MYIYITSVLRLAPTLRYKKTTKVEGAVAPRSTRVLVPASVPALSTFVVLYRFLVPQRQLLAFLYIFVAKSTVQSHNGGKGTPSKQARPLETFLHFRFEILFLHISL